MKKRMHVFYTGRVQGVGFRFAAEIIASQLSLTGWVKNLRDGRVEAVCEGTEKNLNLFLKKIQQELGQYISGEKVSFMEAAGEFDNFTIRFF